MDRPACSKTRVCSPVLLRLDARAVAFDPDRFDRDLDELVYSSLVTVDTRGPETRYRLLDTVRRYALEQLVAHESVDDTYGRFVDHTIARSTELLVGAGQSMRGGMMHDLIDAYSHIAEALRWCIDHDDTPRHAHHLCMPLWILVHQGYADDITALMRRLVARFSDSATWGGAQAHAVLATGEYVTGNLAIAVEIASRTLADRPGPTRPRSSCSGTRSCPPRTR